MKQYICEKTPISPMEVHFCILCTHGKWGLGTDGGPMLILKLLLIFESSNHQKIILDAPEMSILSRN